MKQIYIPKNKKKNFTVSSGRTYPPFDPKAKEIAPLETFPSEENSPKTSPPKN